ncbi:MAG TPA: hypothetical protein VGK67_33610 [Myxococcales bacterium]|jgi:hypothetical protein
MRSLLLVLPVLAGCATAVPAYLLDPERSPPPDCGPDRFLSAVGTSRAGRAAAEEQARAAVVKKLGSRIEIETRRIVEVSSRDGVTTSRRTLNEGVSERAEFKHAELISVVGPPVTSEGETYALACLDRARAASMLAGDLVAPLAVFDSTTARALEAGQRGDRPAFSAAYREAGRASLQCVPVLAQVAALGVEGPEARKVSQALQSLAVEAARLRSLTTFQVALEAPDVPADVASTAADALRQALARVGGEARVGAAACAAGVTYGVSARLEPRCRWGQLGHTCAPHLQLVANECSSGRVAFELGLSDPKQLAGSDLNEAPRALRRALAQLNAAFLEPRLRAALSTELPVD